MTVLLSPVLTLSRRLRPLDPAPTPLQVPLRGTCPPSPERDPVTFTITRWGAGRAVTNIVDAIVGYLQPPHPTNTALRPSVSDRGSTTRLVMASFVRARG
jgi:hypothetical protein